MLARAEILRSMATVFFLARFSDATRLPPCGQQRLYPAEVEEDPSVRTFADHRPCRVGSSSHRDGVAQAAIASASAAVAISSFRAWLLEPRPQRTPR